MRDVARSARDVSENAKRVKGDADDAGIPPLHAWSETAILHLQRQVGNQSVQRLLQRYPNGIATASPRGNLAIHTAPLQISRALDPVSGKLPPDEYKQFWHILSKNIPNFRPFTLTASDRNTFKNLHESLKKLSDAIPETGGETAEGSKNALKKDYDAFIEKGRAINDSWKDEAFAVMGEPDYKGKELQLFINLPSRGEDGRLRVFVSADRHLLSFHEDKDEGKAIAASKEHNTVAFCSKTEFEQGFKAFGMALALEMTKHAKAATLFSAQSFDYDAGSLLKFKADQSANLPGSPSVHTHCVPTPGKSIDIAHDVHVNLAKVIRSYHLPKENAKYTSAKSFWVQAHDHPDILTIIGAAKVKEINDAYGIT